jgi:hypothetical protein
MKGFMKIIFFLVTFLLVGASINLQGKPRLYNLTKKKASVYIEYLGEVEDRYRFSLINNTETTLYYTIIPLKSPKSEESVIYTIEEKRCILDKPNISDMLIVMKLFPSKKIRFSIPNSLIQKDSIIIVTYNYQWEVVKGRLRNPNEPTHQARFRFEG